MQDTNIFVKRLDGTMRQIDWAELNQLKKDILWVYDQNGGELQSAFVPHDSFTLRYWQYSTLDGAYFKDEEKQFYKAGTLIILLCMVAEYIDLEAGSQLVFGDNKLEHIIGSVMQLEPVNENQTSLKQLVLLGLTIAASITKEIISNKDFTHPQMSLFIASLPWVSQTFIQPYYEGKLKK